MPGLISTDLNQALYSRVEVSENGNPYIAMGQIYHPHIGMGYQNSDYTSDPPKPPELFHYFPGTTLEFRVVGPLAPCRIFWKDDATLTQESLDLNGGNGYASFLAVTYEIGNFELVGLWGPRSDGPI